MDIKQVTETIAMIEEQNFDIRTITMGISLLDCIDTNIDRAAEKIYQKITTKAKNLVAVGDEIAAELGIPIVNKRISVTPIAMLLASAPDADPVWYAKTLDAAAKAVGVNFIGGYSALVSKGMTRADKNLILSIPQALSQTERVCSSVNVGSTKTGIDMDAVELMGRIVTETAEATRDHDSLGCAKLVVFCNAPDDNPFMAGAFHGVTEADAIINVGVSGPGVVKTALEAVRGKDFEVLCETIKKTAFKVTRVGQLVAQEASRRWGYHLASSICLWRRLRLWGTAWQRFFRKSAWEYAGAPGNHSSPGLLNDQVKKRGNGILLCRRLKRGIYSRKRGPGHDRCSAGQCPHPGKIGGNDLRLLRRAGYDSHTGRY